MVARDMPRRSLFAYQSLRHKVTRQTRLETGKLFTSSKTMCKFCTVSALMRSKALKTERHSLIEIREKHNNSMLIIQSSISVNW